MDRALEKLIGELCDNIELKKAIIEKDYEEAISIVQEEYNIYNVYIVDEFSFFDVIYNAIKEEDVTMLEELIASSVNLYMYNLIANLLKYFAIISEDASKKEDWEITECYLTDRFSLEKINNLSDEDIKWAAREILELKDKKYFKAEAIREVLKMPIEDDDTNLQIKFVESLIHSNALTYWPLVIGILKGNLDEFMEEYAAMKALREEFYNIQKPYEHETRQLLLNLERISLKN